MIWLPATSVTISLSEEASVWLTLVEVTRIGLVSPGTNGATTVTAFVSASTIVFTPLPVSCTTTWIDFGGPGIVAISEQVGGVTSLMVPRRENVPLKVVLPTMSVPTRSQSGSRSALRIQAWRSGMKGVPGGTIGFGAESQRKCRSGFVSWTCGTKK